MTDDKTKGSGNASTEPLDLKATVALFAAALGTVGLSSELLARAMRNLPEVFGLLMVGAIVLVAYAISRRAGAVRERRLVWALGVLLAVTVAVGAFAFTEREQPWISVSTATDSHDTDLTVVTVKAGAAGLKSREHILVQLQAMNHFPPDQATHGACKRVQIESHEHGRINLAEASAGPLLLHQVAGPDAEGSVAVETSLIARFGQERGLCGWVTLLPFHEKLLGIFPREERWSISYVRLP